MASRELLQHLDALEACVTEEGPEQHELDAARDSLAALREALAAPADPWRAVVLDRLAALCMDAPQDEPPESILRRIIEAEVAIALDPRVSDAAPPAAPAPVGDVVVTKDAQGRIVAVTRQDADGRVLSVIAESAAPVVREPLSREQQIAIREAHCNTASDEYFGARPQIDDVTERRIYEAGFKEGWESGITGGKP